jgi:hypothetical protein
MRNEYILMQKEASSVTHWAAIEAAGFAGMLRLNKTVQGAPVTSCVST